MFKQLRKLASDRPDASDADDPDRGWREILIPAAVQGAVFAAVKAATQRTRAQAFREATGHWPAGH
ncbi:DUF4235 domain-containing protein [Actinomadura napierensis]|uniref:DUF4235 domain-containing protein n=1 Tax=Actinomadura napierensis TaxID=267854 RepID=A0ABP5LC22_9ACTN